jgi:hypothetical protein
MRLSTLALAAALVCLPAAAQMSMPMDKPAAEMKHKAIAPSASLSLVVAGKTVTLTLAQLATLPHKTVTVFNLHANKNESYSGVSLADLLTANGAPFTKATQHAMLHSYILAEGTDGYDVVYSTVEIYTPDYHTGDVIVADSQDGKPLAEDGLKLISSEDKHPMRWVHSLTKITLVAAN